GDCPGAAELTAAVTARLGHAPAGGLRVDFSREGEKHVAVVRSSSGERRLESDAPTCASLGDAAAIAIALALRSEEPPPAPPPVPPPPPPPTPRHEAAPEAPTPPPRSAIFGGAAALIGVLPQVAPAPMLAVRTRFAPRALASAALLYAPSQSTS